MKKRASITDKTAFVVGNGASLSSYNFQALKPYVWVGMNAAYRHWEKSGIYPTYYACLDEVVGLSHAESICGLVNNADSHGIKAFLLRDNLIHIRPELQSHPKVASYEEFFSDLPERVRDLVTTGSHAALWLASLGYKQILMLGIDANYVETIESAQVIRGDQLRIVRPGKNPNYYFEDYQTTGDRFMKPNPVQGVHTGAWRRVAQHLKKAYPDVTLLNGSPVSEIDCADFIDIEAFLKIGSEVTPSGVIFSEQPRLKTRQAHLQVSAPFAFSLAKFVDQLSVAKYHHYSGEGDDIAALSVLGWTHAPLAKLRKQWGLISWRGQAYLKAPINRTQESAIVNVLPNSLEESQDIIDRLQGSFDTVLCIAKTEDDILITPSPVNLQLSPSNIVAFKRERFSQKDLQQALEAAVSENGRGSHRLRRQLYHKLYSLRDAVKIIFRR